MGFRPFKDFGNASRSTLTLRTSGVLFISNGILRKFNAEYCEAVLLFIDDESAKVGLKFIKEFDSIQANCKKLSRERSGVSVNVAPILRYYEVSKQQEKINLAMQRQDDLLILEISSLLSKE